MADVTTQSASIEAHALLRYVHMSPQKARLVIDLIRGQSVERRQAHPAVHAEARGAADRKGARQRHRQRPASRPTTPARRWTKTSCIVTECFINEGPRWKRLRPAPMGRAFRYQKRTAHIWLGVSEHHVAAQERVAAAAAEAESQKGVRGAARRVRKALVGKPAPSKKGKK